MKGEQEYNKWTMREKHFLTPPSPHIHLKKSRNASSNLYPYAIMLTIGKDIPKSQPPVQVIMILSGKRGSINLIKLGHSHIEVGYALSSMTGILMRRVETKYRHSRGEHFRRNY